MTSLTMVWTYCRAVIRTRVEDQRGASVIEYAFLLSLIAVVCFAAIALVGSANGASMSDSASRLAGPP